VVSLRPWRESDIAAAVAGHDAEIMLWFGQDAPPSHEGMHKVLDRWQDEDLVHPLVRGRRILAEPQHDLGVMARDRGSDVTLAPGPK